MPDQTMMIAELQDLPTVTDIPTAARALGLEATVAHALAQSGTFPCRVLKVGGSYRVPSADLIQLLGLNMRDPRSSDSPGIVNETPPAQRSAPKPALDATGHLYLIRFDNRVIKAGYTTDPTNRNVKLARDAGRYDLTIVNQWYSQPLNNVLVLERRLLAVLDALGTRTRAGREYFRNVPFSIACYQAANIDHTGSPMCCCGKCVRPVNVHIRVEVAGDPSSGPKPLNNVEVDLRLPCGDLIRASFFDTDLGPDGRHPLHPAERVPVELGPQPLSGVWTARIESMPSRPDQNDSSDSPVHAKPHSGLEGTTGAGP